MNGTIITLAFLASALAFVAKGETDPESSTDVLASQAIVELFGPGANYEGDTDHVGRPSGKGKIYDRNGKLAYEGRLSHGLPNGKGTLNLRNGDSIRGHFENGKPVFGTMKTRTGVVNFRGKFRNGVPIFNTKNKAFKKRR